MVSIKQLQKSIAKEREKIKRIGERKSLISKKGELKSELFRLQNPPKEPSKLQRLLKKGGKGLVGFGKMIGPKIRKQAKLIRDQQLRDDALARRSKEKRKIIKKRKPIPRSDNIFQGLDFW